MTFKFSFKICAIKIFFFLNLSEVYGLKVNINCAPPKIAKMPVLIHVVDLFSAPPLE